MTEVQQNSVLSINCLILAHIAHHGTSGFLEQALKQIDVIEQERILNMSDHELAEHLNSLGFNSDMEAKKVKQTLKRITGNKHD